MLRRLSLGFALVATAAVAVSACSSGNQNISVGPNFPSQSLYAANATQNAVGIYPPGTKSGSGPADQIGGASTTITGPQYLAFDNLSNLFLTNYNVSANSASIVVIKALATGNVIPFNSVTLSSNVRPRGIAFYMEPAVLASASPSPAFVVAAVNAGAASGFTSQLQFYTDALAQFRVMAGPNTGLNVPSGVAFDSSNNIYVTNLQGASVEVFALPTPSPTPSATASPTTSPSPSPSPSPTPSGATASPSPTPIPTASPINVTPIRTLTTGIGSPTGIALDSNSNIYVSDSAAKLGTTTCAGKAVCPAVLIFPAGANGAVTPKAIAGPTTLLNAPTDVKVDKNGNVYVGDTTTTGAGVIYVFSAGANGNVAPNTTFTSPGAVIGIGLTP